MDISGDYLRDVVRALAADYPGSDAAAAGRRFHPAAGHSRPGRRARRAGFFPGSTIGNFTPDAAMALLRRMRGMLKGGGLLIGVDLVKDPARLHAAYNDAAGVTAAVQQESAGARQSRTGRRFRSGRLRPLCALQSRGASDRDVSGQPQAPEREPDAASVSISPPGEADPYRGQPQIHASKVFREMAARAGFRPRAVWTDPERLFCCTGWKAESLDASRPPAPRCGGLAIAARWSAAACLHRSDLNRPGEVRRRK